MAAQPEIRVLDGIEELYRSAANEFTRLAVEAVRARRRFCVALSGGSTPKGLYTLLAGSSLSSIPWDKVYFFWGDERHVPPDHPDSNYRMTYEALLSKVPVPAGNVYRIPAEQADAEAAARAYEQTISSFFGLREGQFPRFDLVLLGMGLDGHTASLFPATPALHEKHRLVVANWVEKFKSHRITLTLPVLNHAACVMFMVSGREKAPVLRRVLHDDSGTPLPAQMVRPLDGRLLWLVDREAADL